MKGSNKLPVNLEEMMSRHYRVSPSSLNYLYRECESCFKAQIVKKIYRPSISLPGVFMGIDGAMKSRTEGMPTSEISPQLPKGVLAPGGKVESIWVDPTNPDIALILGGYPDTLANFDDGNTGVLDFKTAGRSKDEWDIYVAQLSAYAYCLEHPLRDKHESLYGTSDEASLIMGYPAYQDDFHSVTPWDLSKARHVSDIGLVVYTPDYYDFASGSDSGTKGAYLGGTQTWYPLEYDRHRFDDLCRDVYDVLTNPQRGKPSNTCKWCAFNGAENKWDWDHLSDYGSAAS